jgi:outer membrane protein assembly factor BamB
MRLHPGFWLVVALAALPARADLSSVALAKEDDWAQWRGAARTGISAETGWMETWPADGPRILWKAQVGIGFSSFAVAKGRVYTIGHANDADTVFCLDADKGQVLWYHPYPADLGDKFFEGGPTSTPTVDGDRVYTISKWGDLFCFDAASGKIAWQKNLATESSLPIPAWGFGGSPFILGDLLLLNIGEAGIALEKATGRIVWKSAAAECGYSTPLPLPGSDSLVIFTSGRGYHAVDAKTGKEAWRVKWMTQYGVNAADPVFDNGTMLISTGYGKGAALFKLGAGEPELVWQNKSLRSQMNPPVLIGGFLYGVDGDAGQKTALKCVEMSTGTEKWSVPLTGSGALAAADGKLIVLGGDGTLMIAPAAAADFKPTAQAKVLTGKCWTVPVLANGRLYCRNAEGHVVCVDLRKP